MPEDYEDGFEMVLNKKYLKNVGQLQHYIKRVWTILCILPDKVTHGEKKEDIVKDFNLHQKKRNDCVKVTKIMALCSRQRMR